MSETIETLYQNAQLADAAYLNWQEENGEILNDLTFKRESRGSEYLKAGQMFNTL